jgi:hypothetical protein
MTTFYVGQRVRLARRPDPSELLDGSVKTMPGRVLVGDQGTVMGTDSNPNAGFIPGPFPRLSVRVDKLGAYGMSPASVWEPIVPKGAQPSEFTTLHELLDSLELVAA